MLAYSSTENNHSSFSRLSRELIECTDVAHDIHNQSRITEGVEVDHISQRTVSKRRTKDRNIVLEGFVQHRICATRIGIHFVGPVIYRFLVIYFFSESSDEAARRPDFARLLLFSKHCIENRSQPVLKFAVIVVGDNEVADSVHASFS